MRKAFSMITALFVIVIMATIATLVFNISGKTVKSTLIQYRSEQAALLARSYTELAVMAVMNHNRQKTPKECIETIQGVIKSLEPGVAAPAGVTSTNNGAYRVKVNIYYLGNNLPCSEGKKLNDSTNGSRSNTVIQTDYGTTSHPDQLAAILVDVKVQYKDLSSDKVNTSKWITYHRRTLQKI